jgi:hypothetical protein
MSIKGKENCIQSLSGSSNSITLKLKRDILTSKYFFVFGITSGKNTFLETLDWKQGQGRELSIFIFIREFAYSV